MCDCQRFTLVSDFNINQRQRASSRLGPLQGTIACTARHCSALHLLAFRIEVRGDGVSQGAELQSSLLEAVGRGRRMKRTRKKKKTLARAVELLRVNSAEKSICCVIYGV